MGPGTPLTVYREVRHGMMVPLQELGGRSGSCSSKMSFSSEWTLPRRFGTQAFR